MQVKPTNGIVCPCHFYDSNDLLLFYFSGGLGGAHIGPYNLLDATEDYEKFNISETEYIHPSMLLVNSTFPRPGPSSYIVYPGFSPPFPAQLQHNPSP